MKFSGSFSVPAARPIVYQKLNDPAFFASCVEGVQSLAEIDPTHYTAVIETRIAYIKWKFEMAIALLEQVEPERVVASAEGVPIGIVGRLTATATATLAEQAEDHTDVSYEIDFSLAGKLGSIGQPVLRSKAKDMEKSFVKNVNAAFMPPAEVEAGA